MHAHQCWLALFFHGATGVQTPNSASGECQVRKRVHRTAPCEQTKNSLGRLNVLAIMRLNARHHHFARQAPLNHLLHRAHFQLVLGAYFFQLRQARHFAIGLHNFNNRRRGLQTSQPTQINAAFGLTRANKHAAIARAQWIHVTRAREVRGLRGWIA